MLQALAQEHGKKLVFVGVGGVSDVDSAVEKLRAGASLVQVYTGFVYGGPSFARDVLRGLTRTPEALVARKERAHE